MGFCEKVINYDLCLNLSIKSYALDYRGITF